MKIRDIQKGDIVIYTNNKTNYVNKPKNYIKHYKEDFTRKDKDKNYSIRKILRYKKILFKLYVLVPVYNNYPK